MSRYNDKYEYERKFIMGDIYYFQNNLFRYYKTYWNIKWERLNRAFYFNLY